MRLLEIASLAALIGPAGCVSAPTEHLAAEQSLGPYSGSVRTGSFVFCSGKIGARGSSFEHEVRTAIDAVEAELARSGLTLRDAVQVTAFLTDLDAYPEFNAIYAERFGPPYPARATVEVTRLPGDARVELQVIAAQRQ